MSEAANQAAQRFTPDGVPIVDGAPTHLLGKLAEIQSAIDGVARNGENTDRTNDSYTFVRAEDLLRVVRKEMAERRVLLLPAANGIKRTIIENGAVTAVALTYTFYDAESGESLAFEWRGTGEDSGDKGLYKAITGALKYFLLNAFLIPTGDDPERSKTAEGRESGESAPQLADPVREVPTDALCRKLVATLRSEGVSLSTDDGNAVVAFAKSLDAKAVDFRINELKRAEGKEFEEYANWTIGAAREFVKEAAA